MHEYLLSKIEPQYIEGIVQDFVTVSHKPHKFQLVRKNISKYGFYTLRLCSRRQVELRCKVNDLKPGQPTIRYFEHNLYSIAWPSLGWDVDPLAKGDIMYQDWL